MTAQARRLADSFFSSNRWIMLLALLCITGFMLLASHAHAANYINAAYGSMPMGQTISHCGMLPTTNKIYARTNRNYRNAHKVRNARIVQTQLERMGYSVGRAGTDGKFGPKTRRAVSHFQKDARLARDGVVGENTARNLAYWAHPNPNVRKCQRMARQDWR